MSARSTVLDWARYLIARGWPDGLALEEARAPRLRDILASHGTWADGPTISVQWGPDGCVHLYTPIGLSKFSSRAAARVAWDEMRAEVLALTPADVDPDGSVRSSAIVRYSAEDRARYPRARDYYRDGYCGAHGGGASGPTGATGGGVILSTGKCCACGPGVEPTYTIGTWPPSRI